MLVLAIVYIFTAKDKTKTMATSHAYNILPQHDLLYRTTNVSGDTDSDVESGRRSQNLSNYPGPSQLSNGQECSTGNNLRDDPSPVEQHNNKGFQKWTRNLADAASSIYDSIRSVPSILYGSFRGGKSWKKKDAKSNPEEAQAFLSSDSNLAGGNENQAFETDLEQGKEAKEALPMGQTVITSETEGITSGTISVNGAQIGHDHFQNNGSGENTTTLPIQPSTSQEGEPRDQPPPDLLPITDGVVKHTNVDWQKTTSKDYHDTAHEDYNYGCKKDNMKHSSEPSFLDRPPPESSFVQHNCTETSANADNVQYLMFFVLMNNREMQVIMKIRKISPN